MLLLARRTGLIADIDHYLHLFKYHRPYHESDHVLNIALNILAGGTKLQHIERRRNDEAYLNALDAKRIPDPTTTGDFCRRSRRCDVLDLMDAINRTRKRVGPSNLSTSLTRLSSTPTAPSSAPTPSAKRASISPTTAPGAIIPCWSRWPTPRSRCTWSIAAATVPRMNWPPASSTGPSSSAARPGSARFGAGGHRLHPDQASRPLG